MTLSRALLQRFSCAAALWAALSACLASGNLFGAEASFTLAEPLHALTTRLDQALSSTDIYQIASCDDAVRRYAASQSAEPQDLKIWRRQTLELWLVALERVRRHLDPSFDPNDLPSLNLAPMVRNGGGLSSGADPSSIQDVAVRADYEQRLQENARQASQLALHRLDTAWTNQLKSHLESYYTSSPQDIAEVNELILRRITAPGDRERLREQLAERLPPAEPVAAN